MNNVVGKDSTINVDSGEFDVGVGSGESGIVVGSGEGVNVGETAGVKSPGSFSVFMIHTAE